MSARVPTGCTLPDRRGPRAGGHPAAPGRGRTLAVVIPDSAPPQARHGAAPAAAAATSPPANVAVTQNTPGPTPADPLAWLARHARDRQAAGLRRRLRPRP
ncbi:8-amino-7-oxononanoate synthase, partial [Frankia sp. AgKG'84/4]|nr:8-amino-7-oxononanoate synthase [Frankia sp. AgKG'84/4]